MRRPARILLAGTLIATTSFAGVATSQTVPSTVDSDQVQLGDVFATQTLNVVDVGGDTTVTTTATGNSLSGAVETGRLQLTSSQAMHGDASATTTIAGAGALGDALSVVTEAVGNTGDASAYGASLSATVGQSVDGAAVTATTVLDAPAGRIGAGGANVSTNAIANAQAYGVVDGRADTATTQTNAALVQAETDATVQYAPGPTTFASSAVANSVASGGTGAATQTATVSQSMTGARTQAATFVGVGAAWNLQGTSTAVANNVAIGNDGGSIDATVTQDDQTYVRAQTSVGAYQFGRADAQAFATANSVGVGGETGLALIDNTQFASGGVEAIADFTGHDGYDASALASATGNAITGYACSDCAGVLGATSRQTNDSDVSATASTTTTGPVRSVTGTAVATGNAATFYVTRPGH
jgi:hypothetical protein